MSVNLASVLAEHHRNAGWIEGANNRNPWGPEQGVGNNQAYCDSAASMVPYHAGYRWWPESQFGEKGCAYTVSHVNVGLKHGEVRFDYSNNPADIRAGDLLFYDWSGGKGSAGIVDHVETAVENAPPGPSRTHNIGYNALPLDALVLTPTGWRRNGDLAVGGEVIDPTTGGPTKIVGYYPKGRRPVFTVRCQDGSSVEADAEHLWTVQIPDGRKPRGEWPERVMTTTQLAERIGAGQKAYLPRMRAAEFTVTEPLPVDPWLLGFLIGDGNFREHGVRFSSMDRFCVDMVEATLPGRCTLGPNHETREGFSPSFFIRGEVPGHQHSLLNALRDLGLCGVKAPQKFVPESYKWASVKDRIAVLQGLMDADGSVDAEGRIDFTTSSHLLAEDVQHVVRSLGGKVTPTSVVGGRAYKMRLTLPPEVNPFRLPRKAEKVKARKRSVGWAVVSVEASRETEVACFKVASEAELFVTNDFLVTHNTGSPNGCHDLWRDRKYLVCRLRPLRNGGYAQSIPVPVPIPQEDEEDMPIAYVETINPGESKFVCVPPCASGGAGWGVVWGSLGVDNYDAADDLKPSPVRIAIKGDAPAAKGWRYMPEADKNGFIMLQSGRSFAWVFGKADQGVSLQNQGKYPICLMIEAVKA